MNLESHGINSLKVSYGQRGMQLGVDILVLIRTGIRKGEIMLVLLAYHQSR